MSIITGFSGGMVGFPLVFGDAFSLLFLEIKIVLTLGLITCVPVWYVQLHFYLRPGKNKHETSSIATYLATCTILILTHVIIYHSLGHLIFNSLNVCSLAFSSEQLFFLPSLRFLDVYLKCITHISFLGWVTCFCLRVCSKKDFANRLIVYLTFTFTAISVISPSCIFIGTLVGISYECTLLLKHWRNDWTTVNCRSM